MNRVAGADAAADPGAGHAAIMGVRRSPFAAAWAATVLETVQIRGMTVPERFGHSIAAVGFADLSFLPRTGFKGPGTEAWLRAVGLPVPAVPNQWLPHRGGLVARLGLSEFLLESSTQDPWTDGLAPDGQAAVDMQIAPVLRQDASLLLFGERVLELCSQVCSFEVVSLNEQRHELVMTLMLGIGVTLIRLPTGSSPAWRLWCDPSFGDSLWRTLEALALELGGAPRGRQELAVLDGAQR